MAIEREPNREASLFMPASLAAQKDTALKFLQATKALLSNHEEIYYIASLENKINNPEVDSEIAIRAAIHGYDLYFSDEIRSYLPVRSPKTTDAAAIYYRSDVYKQTFPQQIRESLSNLVDSPIQDVVMATREHIRRFNPTSGSTGMLTPEIAYWIGTETNPIVKPDPPCGVARQELYRSLLSCGVNPLEGIQPIVDSASERIDIKLQPDSTYSRMFRRKGEISLHATEKDLVRWMENSSKHWRNILKEGVENTQDSSILFSSGTSSAEAILLALSKATNGNAYIHHYWYYENIATAQRIFRISDKIDHTTQVVLINLEPTNFFTFDKSAHIENPIRAIGNLAQICRENPGTNRYVVVDVTIDPLFQVTEHLGDHLPSNLHVIKTLSASKHQRGGRKYFFGVAYTTNKKLFDEITRAKSLVGGNVYEPHIVHFPRPSTIWLAKQSDTVKSINSQAAKDLSQKNESGWVLRPHTYHTFFFPPPEVLERIQTLGTQNGSVEAEVEHFNDAVSRIVANVVNEVNSPFIDLGDSFGLPFTRVCTQGGYNELNGVRFRLKLPRICPGYDTPPALVEETMRKLLNELSVSHDKIIETLN